MGGLKPDVLVRRAGRVVAVIDAKYKRLANTQERPDGVDRSDLYQLVSRPWLSRSRASYGCGLGVGRWPS